MTSEKFGMLLEHVVRKYLTFVANDENKYAWWTNATFQLKVATRQNSFNARTRLCTYHRSWCRAITELQN